jgi:hypothetical protein
MNFHNKKGVDYLTGSEPMAHAYVAVVIREDLEYIQGELE